jgi:tetratricopeptide (TPR) repeat protein
MFDRDLRRLNQAEGYLVLGLPARTIEIVKERKDWGRYGFHASFLEGEALRTLERYKEASECLERAATMRPDDVDTAIALGWCYKRTHRLAQAIDVLDRISRRDPSIALVRYNLACYWSIAGNLERAIVELRAAIRIEPAMVGLASSEVDFDPIRTEPAFQKILGSASALST